MRRLQAIGEAVLGRSLLARIWGQSTLVFVGVAVLVLFAPYTVPRRFFLPGTVAYLFHAGLLLLAALLVAFTAARPLARRIARPLAELGGLARSLGEGDLTARAPVEGRDEIAELARSFNRMAGDIQRLRGVERQLLADVSHELRTPLARMRVVLDLAADADPAETQRYLREIASDLGELDELLGDIIVSSRLDQEDARWTEARPLHRRRIAEAHGGRLSFESRPGEGSHFWRTLPAMG